MRHLATSGMTVMGLEDLSDCLREMRPWPSEGVVVTLDDGFRCAYQVALPILERHGIPATVFVVVGKLGKTSDWMHTSNLLHRELLGWDELREMRRRGICLGSHTVTHPHLTELSPSERTRELEDSRKVLEEILGHHVTQFAYPFGQFDESVRRAVERAGYQTACSTQPGFNRSGTDRFALRRIDVYGRDTFWTFKQKLRFAMNKASPRFVLRYYQGRLLSRIGFNCQ